MVLFGPPCAKVTSYNAKIESRVRVSLRNACQVTIVFVAMNHLSVRQQYNNEMQQYVDAGVLQANIAISKKKV